MGLTTKNLQSQIVHPEPPHYFEVVNTEGERYRHCGKERDAINLVDMNPGFSYHKVYFPASPQTVDVMSVTVGKEQTLPAQQILPESQQEPLNL